MSGYKEKSEFKDCWNIWCIGRCGCFQPIAVAVIVTISIFAFAAALIAYLSTSFSTTQIVYSASATMATSPMNHVLYNMGPPFVTLTIPNNMIEYIGAQYNIACGNAGHVIRIAPGPLTTTFNALGNTVATCTAPFSGLSIQIISSSHMRIIASNGVTFT